MARPWLALRAARSVTGKNIRSGSSIATSTSTTAAKPGGRTAARLICACSSSLISVVTLTGEMGGDAICGRSAAPARQENRIESAPIRMIENRRKTKMDDIGRSKAPRRLSDKKSASTSPSRSLPCRRPPTEQPSNSNFMKTAEPENHCPQVTGRTAQHVTRPLRAKPLAPRGARLGED